MSSQPVIQVQGVQTRFGSNVIHRDVTFEIPRGEVVALIGGSGCGKSVLLREIIGLLPPSGGEIKMFGTDVWKAEQSELAVLRRRIGVLFQNGALFSALSVGENVSTPLMENGGFDAEFIEEIVRLRLALSGLDPKVATKMPSELSGGMRKRVALARALALEPELLFLDEPTSGLDPISARAFDKLIRTLSENLGLTVVMVTHDLDTLLSIVDRIVALSDGQVLANGSVGEVSAVDHPWIKSYFSARAS